MPGTRDIEVYQGDRWSERYVFRRNVGTAEAPVWEPVDFSGQTPRAQVRYKENDAAPAATFECSYDPDATSGAIVVVLPSTQSAQLIKDGLWDLETVTAEGEATTWLRGQVALTKQITRVT